MEHSTLIFPIIFTDLEFDLITIERDRLADSLILLHELGQEHPSLLKTKIELAILDLNEIINRHNVTGYKWTSYVVSILLIKIQFLISILAKMDSNKSLELFENLLSVHSTLDEILERKRIEANDLVN